MVASSVAPCWPPWIRLPASTLRSEMRPASGARTSVQSRLSSALRTAASAVLSWARATARLALRWSYSASVMVRELISEAPRWTCSSAISTCALLRATSASALWTAISNGRLSMVNSRSPTLTSWPSRKCSLSMKPETRARTSTEATASKRPENSSHWVTRLAIGGAMVTGMAGGPPWAKAADEVTRKARPAAASRRRCKDKRELPRERFAARHMWL